MSIRFISEVHNVGDITSFKTEWSVEGRNVVVYSIKGKDPSNQRTIVYVCDVSPSRFDYIPVVQVPNAHFNQSMHLQLLSDVMERILDQINGLVGGPHADAQV